MAFVRGVIAASTAEGSRHHDSGRISTNTGRAPRWTIGAALAIQLVSAMMTSSPGPMPSAAMPMCKAPVQLDVAMAYSVPICCLNPCSKRPRYS
ncbi:hypothetical protein D3C87_1682600 [compost metagenome]